MEDLSLHILDIAENSINAHAKNIIISLVENTDSNLLTLIISDDGDGIDQETLQILDDPFYTTRTTRKVGLGLPLLKQAAVSANGDMKVESKLGCGTKVTATFNLNHPDRQPIGNIADTIVALMLLSAEVEILYEHKKNEMSFVLDTKKIKQTFSSSGSFSTDDLLFLRKYIIENEKIFL